MNSSSSAVEESSSKTTLSPPSDRSSCHRPSPDSQQSDVVKVLSPELDRLGSISLPQAPGEGGERVNLPQAERKRRRKSGDEDVVALSLSKGKHQRKTIYVASIKSFFR